MNIDVSFVVTVYNKEYYLPHVLKALFNQEGLGNPEFIFVDDKSNDKSVEIVRQISKNIKNVTIIENPKNMGISPTINVGIMKAKGEFIRMIDSDDMLPIDSTIKMLELAKKHNADMVYGTFRKTGKKAEELVDMSIGEIDYKYYPDAIEAVLEGRFTRMGQLIKTSVLQKAGGADERVFIQDETIPVRSAIRAKGIIKMQNNVVLVPEEIGNFSGNKTQLNHDRFFAYYFAIVDNLNLNKNILAKMYKKAVSAYWKEIKASAKNPYMTSAFYKYLASKVGTPNVDREYLEMMKKYFDAKVNVRRTELYKSMIK